jgi:hypothetical protein
MKTAGKYLQLAQGVGEAALLGHLRSKYKLQLDLPRLAQMSKDELRERQLPITPTSFVQMADELASREVTMLEDMVGVDYTRWNPATKSYEEYIYPDPRQYFIR